MTHWQRVLASKTSATLTGCRLDEMEGLLKTEVDRVGMALRLGDSKTGKSIRPVGAAVISVLKTAMCQIEVKVRVPGRHDRVRSTTPVLTQVAAEGRQRRKCRA